MTPGWLTDHVYPLLGIAILVIALAGLMCLLGWARGRRDGRVSEEQATTPDEELLTLVLYWTQEYFNGTVAPTELLTVLHNLLCQPNTEDKRDGIHTRS